MNTDELRNKIEDQGEE